MIHCYECRHWRKSGQGEDRGECRIIAPIGVMVPKNGNGLVEYRAHWPITIGTEDCGEGAKAFISAAHGEKKGD